ncbi:MAG: cobalt ECF transporter T component CbiQ [Desulfohalobiaceae bacterium]
MLLQTLIQGDSFLHRCDPRVKICVALPFAVTAALLQTFPAAVAAIGISCILLLWARLPVSEVLGRLALVNMFILFLWLFLPFSTPGQEAFSLGPLLCTWQGLALAGLITLKSNAVVLAILALLATSSIPSLGHALSRLGLPDKLTFLLLISYRYLEVIFQEYHRLQEAARIRAFRPGTNMHTYRTYGHLLAMVLLNSYERAQRVYQAMLLRGFQGRFYSLQEFQLVSRDIYFLLGLAAAICGLILLDWTPELL